MLHITMGSHHPAGAPGSDPRLGEVDIYRLPDTDLRDVRGLITCAGADQIFLERNRELLTGFVRAGGRVAVMGHPVTDFLPGLGVWRELDYTGPKDLQISLGDPHPVWAGIDPVDLSVRKGVTGFYSRGYVDKLPPDAVITTRIGRHALPLDYVYPLGAGQVLVHSGNDLINWEGDANTAARMTPQLIDWLVAR
ncbi:hypothetical protein LTT02_05385 [Mycolicibacterium smegmatis]|uniref:hypothetical protein n=1 Tax=Mycolicibacterium smegmatis TaxID=1772 RepID=UPI001CC16790|nr:hypothetical protein [Mycolicibacterium smegmatis]MDF1898611.1 hypothetical protein [Mycolicibacterium smegmatis]MDF1908838.1 hypothetical protein [Mycolicibacterium smegmatis]MDF1915667.1 hypothetical protein [Mycolicibacterium smegmatis]MDF1927366.1 hypothetical protein [Mycolicibacterium smegmatis]UGT76436.1 hypothetical protein LTT02_05385 [Mycolicibacterium smegmatis]